MIAGPPPSYIGSYEIHAHVPSTRRAQVYEENNSAQRRILQPLYNKGESLCTSYRCFS